MIQSFKPQLKKSTLKDSSQQLLLYLNTCSINDKDLFLKKQHADIFLIIKSTNKMYPLISRCVIHNCGFFRAKRGQKCIIFEEDFKEEDITNILSLMYGYSLIFDRSKVKDYFGILHKLQFDYMIKVLKNDIFTSFQAYDIFILLELADSYQFYDIMDCCKSQLLRQNFQQFRYNLYDLLHCSEEVFTLIINFHNQAQKQKRVKGLLYNQIVDIVQQYCNQNLGSTKGLMLLTEITGSKKLVQSMISSKIYNNNRISNHNIISSIQQQKVSQTQSILNQKSQTFYSQIIANIEKSVNKTPKKHNEKIDYKTIFEEKNTFIQRKSPNLKNINSQNSDCDSMMKTRLPTQSVILTKNKNSSKQKGAYKPWQAKKNQSKIASTPMINSIGIPLSKHMSEQSSIPRTPNLMQKRQTQNASFIEEQNKSRPNYFKKQQKTQKKQPSYPDKNEQMSNQKINMARDKFIQNSISPMFESASETKATTKEFLYAPNSIKQVSEVQDSNYMEHAQLLKRIQMEPPRQSKSTKKIPKLNQKTSIEFLIDKSVRKGSYEAKELKFQKEYIPPHKKSPILKQIEELNKQCESIQQQNFLLIEQVKSIKSNFARKEIQRKQYKESLIQMDKMLQKLQRQFEAQNQQLIKISAKIQQNRDRDNNSGLLFSSICSSISDHFF